MKKLIIVLVALSATFASFAQTGKDTTHHGKTKAPAAVKYTCPMHPEVVMDKPGKCPKCGMTLVVKKTTDKMPMHKMDTTKMKMKM